MCFSAFFLKARAAGTAGHSDLTFSAGDPELLAAMGTLEITMLLVPVDGTAQMEPALKGADELEEFRVFGPPPGRVAGEQTEQRPRQQGQGDPDRKSVV